MAVLDSAEVHLLIHALREPLNSLARDIGLLDGDNLPTSIEPAAKAIRASLDKVLIALGEIESALDDWTANPQRPRGR